MVPKVEVSADPKVAPKADPKLELPGLDRDCMGLATGLYDEFPVDVTNDELCCLALRRRLAMLEDIATHEGSDLKRKKIVVILDKRNDKTNNYSPIDSSAQNVLIHSNAYFNRQLNCLGMRRK